MPVLLLTARGAVEERICGLNAGADDYLAKPFDLGSWMPGCEPCCGAAKAVVPSCDWGT